MIIHNPDDAVDLIMPKSIGAHEIARRFYGLSIPSNFGASSWMELHIDEYGINYGKGGNERTWIIRPIAWRDDARFLYREGGIFKSRKFGDVDKLGCIEFDRTKLHGILPVNLAKEVVRRNSRNFADYRKWVTQTSTRDYKIRVLFEFIAKIPDKKTGSVSSLQPRDAP